MKKISIFVVLATFGLFNTYAQEEESTFGFAKGDIFIEGNVGFSSSKDTDALDVETKTNGFNFNPKAGYLINDKFAVGVELAFLKSKREEASVIERDLSAFGGGVFARYYFFELGKRFKTYSELGLGYATAKNKYPVGTETATETDNIFNVGLDLGANFFVTEKIAITFGLMDILSISNIKSDSKISGNNPGEISSSGTDVNFGFGNVNNPFSNVSFGILFKL